MRFKLFLLLFFTLSVLLSAQGNPFTGGSAPVEPSSLPSILPIPKEMRDFQKELHTQLGILIRESQEKPSALALLLITAFLYGLFHSLLPGHQKTLVTAFYLSHDASRKSALVTGILFTFLHMVSSVGIYVTVLIVTNLSSGSLGYGASSELAGYWTQNIAALGAVALGIYLLVETLTDWKNIKLRQDINKIRSLMNLNDADLFDNLHLHPSGKKNYWIMLAVAGLMPCPGTLLVLFFAFSLGAHLFGILAAVAISLGVGFVLSIISLIAISARKGGGKLFHGQTSEKLAVFFQVTASILILITSLFLLH